MKSRTTSTTKICERTPTVEFTDASRLRMLKRVNSFDRDLPWESSARFVTLTYSSVYPGDFKVWKKHLDIFRKRLMRLYGRFGCVWKLEPQRRGAPHFHLLAMLTAPHKLKDLRAWCAVNWSEIVNRDVLEPQRSYDEQQMRSASTSVTRVKHFGGVLAYAAKYVGKAEGPVTFVTPQGEFIPPGRFWGIWHEELLIGDRRVEVSDEVTMYRVRRTLRKLMHKKGVDCKTLRNHKSWNAITMQSITAFVDADTVDRLFDFYAPWRAIGVPFHKWRSIELTYRRAAYLRRCLSEWVSPLDESAG